MDEFFSSGIGQIIQENDTSSNEINNDSFTDYFERHRALMDNRRRVMQDDDKKQTIISSLLPILKSQTFDRLLYIEISILPDTDQSRYHIELSDPETDPDIINSVIINRIINGFRDLDYIQSINYLTRINTLIGDDINPATISDSIQEVQEIH